MAGFAEAKVYFDGSHYIAIPHTTRPTKRRPKPAEEMIEVPIEEDEIDWSENVVQMEEISSIEEVVEEIKKESVLTQNQPKKIKQVTKKELFDELYSKHIDLKKLERKKLIVNEMQSYFKDIEKCEAFVNTNFERKQRNLICRRVRMVRKANLAGFNYFCTFTYDDKKHSENTFRKKLKCTLGHFSSRKGWKYMGVWEKAPETKRLHFHGLFFIPENTMPGSLEEHKDFNFKSKRRTTTFQNTYFNNNFGRSDFVPIGSVFDLQNELMYIMKYMEKSEEKIVYSKGLSQYFISDILEDDVVCRIGQEDKKLLLFDNFKCIDEGELMGEVSPEVIERMRKSNS